MGTGRALSATGIAAGILSTSISRDVLQKKARCTGHSWNIRVAIALNLPVGSAKLNALGASMPGRIHDSSIVGSMKVIGQI
eukprot:scaffold219484_cov27-Tisochrysis_lutea.AAC.1